MKISTALKLTLTMAFAITAVMAFGFSYKVSAHEESAEENAEHANVTYAYTAQSGDSYTKIARKAVQTFGLTEKINLSQAGIIYAETNLTRAAGSPALNVGQKVEITKTVVHDWVDKASNLTDAQEAAWNYYVQFVDFNTNSVGQPN